MNHDSWQKALDLYEFYQKSGNKEFLDITEASKNKMFITQPFWIPM